MGDKDRLNRPELQTQVDQVANSPEIIRELDRPSVHQNPATRSRTTFPAAREGRDGDECYVVSEGRAYLCRKIRGRWRKFKDE